MKNKWMLRKLSKAIGKKVNQHKKRHEDQHRIHLEYHKRVKELYHNNKDFDRYRKHVRYTRPIIMIFNLLIWFLIFHYFGVKVISLVFALLISVGGLLEFFFLANLEKRIFKPINELKSGVEELAKGNYEVRVQTNIANNEIAILVDSFNEMVEKLRESEKLKLQYEENRKSLIANISHDLKTPITSIQGYIETMAGRTDIPQEIIDKYHQIIYNNAAYMNKLIDDLFLFSKLDMDKLELNLEDISIKAFMNDLMEEFKFELEDRHIGFEYEDKAAGNPEVSIDRKRVQQIFSNILGNAIKYGFEENTRINVVLSLKDNDVYINIKDNGPGIPEDKLPYIFDRFYRVDFARTKNLMSTGLGLAISKELVEAHGGKITADSKENEGTCFTIMFPAKPKGEDK